ncbi:hypothetical protein TWF694_009000 [Orbilia ellipsospora]|uniref:Fido domain-containing protein n=1 Tax=Orbilia ellipsospora TaxID=2528407 RepID=A0AAV9XDZ7_9PEZI
MASEYESVRSRILSGENRRPSLPTFAFAPLSPTSPPRSQRSSIPLSLPSPGSTLFDSSAPDHCTFISSLSTHIRHLSESRLSQGFLHLHASPIHSPTYLPDTSQTYSHITGLFRRIDISFYNLSPARLESFLSHLIIRFIHSSTYLSNTGTDLSTTSKICHSIFSSTGIAELNLPNTEGYRSELDAISSQGHPPTLTAILRGREAVVHYTNALVYFIQSLIRPNGELTQDLIKETHRILVQDSDPVDDKTWEQFGGWYRDYRLVSVNEGENEGEIDKDTTTAERAHRALSVESPISRRASSVYPITPLSEEGRRLSLETDRSRRESINPAAVGMYMSKLVYSYHAQLALDKSQADGGEANFSDPFALSAWLVCQFLHIHPFVVGNEEMGRIILAGVLMKKLGIVAIIGEDKKVGRVEYMGILERYMERHRGEGAAEEGDEEAYSEFAALVVRKALSCVGEFAAMVGSS